MIHTLGNGTDAYLGIILPALLIKTTDLIKALQLWATIAAT